MKAKVRAVMFYDAEWQFLRDYATRNETTISATILDALQEQYPEFPHHERGKGGAPLGNQNWRGAEQETRQ